MAFSRTWDAAYEATPEAGANVGQGDDRIRNLKTDVRERQDVDHYMDETGTDADHGEHRKITLNAPISTPTAVANKGFVYGKDVGGKIELHYLDEDDNEIQLTSGGVIKRDFSAIAEDIIPDADDTRDLGSAAKQWAELHAVDLHMKGTEITSTAAELNILDGVTATAAELNILDGVTSDKDELNLLDGKSIANKAAMEAATANALVVANLLHNHPAVPKAWIRFDGTGSITGDNGYNCSVARNSTGNYTVTFVTDFADTNYCVVAVPLEGNREIVTITKATGTYRFRNGASSTPSGSFDGDDINLAFFGDQ